MTTHLNMFDVMTALQTCRIWLELYRDDALQKAIQMDVYHLFEESKLSEHDTKKSVEACYVFDTATFNEIGITIDETRNQCLYLKNTLTMYLNQIESRNNVDDKARIDAIKTGLYLLDHLITSIDKQKGAKKVLACLDITPAFAYQISNAIRLLEKEGLNLMQLGLGINFTPPHRG